MDQMENYSDELQNLSEEAQLGGRPSLPRVKKSWGFRRTTIARREFLEEVGELAHSPPPVRKTRSRRNNQTPSTTPEAQDSPRHTPTTRTVVDELEWSAPSSPVAEDKPATETFAGGNLDPSLWQDCGSAFHTAFSLLGGGEDFQVEMPDSLAVTDTVEADDSSEAYVSCVTDESAMPINEDFPDGILDGDTLLGEVGEMLRQKGGQEPRYATINRVKGSKGRVKSCATDEPAMPDNEDSPDDAKHSLLGDVGGDSEVLFSTQEGHSDGEIPLRETGEMLTRSVGQQRRGTRVRGVKGGKGRGRLCATNESTLPNNEDSLDDITHSVLEDTRGDSDVVLISPQEEPDSDCEITLISEKLLTPEVVQEHRDTTVRGVKGGKGRGRKKGRGRGRRKAKGRGKPGGLQSNPVDEVIDNPTEQEQEVLKLDSSDSPVEIPSSPAHPVGRLSSAQQSSSDCICIESDVDQVINETNDQLDDALEQKDKEVSSNGQPSLISDPDGCDPDVLTCICRQKRNDRFTVRCVSCQKWFHGDCVGVSEMGGSKGYVCPTCIPKNQSEHQPKCCPQPEIECSLPQGSTQSLPDEEMEGKSEQQTLEEPKMMAEEQEKTKVPVINLESGPQAKMKEDGTLPLCIGPGCPREALPDSVYCGTDCIIQHAAATMKTLCVPKELKTRGGMQKKPATTTASAKGQRSCGTSKNLVTKAEDEEKDEDGGGQKEAAPSSPCDPAPTEVQATSLPSSKLYTASKMAKTSAAEAAAPLNQSLEEPAADAAPPSQPGSEAEAARCHLPETPKEPVISSLSADARPRTPPNTKATVSEAPSTSVTSHLQTAGLKVTKKAFVIPKKPPAPQSLASPVLASASGPKPSPAPAPLNETRNLLVPPAPSAPSSRPSQPNNQIRQSIQKSLVTILVKRVGECEDLKMSESEVVKLVASIEVEMFDIFRNTDSKYMNKYRTIMFNLKDPRNKGLLYGFVRGEISPFRLVRMTQKDMQAIKASETTEKQTLEVRDTAAAKITSVLPKPEAVKVDLPTLGSTRLNRGVEQKKILPPLAVKTKTIQPNRSSAVPDILTCMLKDTTSEHKTHIFDLKCKICTGQISATDEEEPSKKKARESETREKNYPPWRRSTEDDSPLKAPPESPDLDSPTSLIIDTSPHLTYDSPVLTIVESPASPIMDSPASPVLESPASPVMDSPASPATSDPPKASTSKSIFTPAISTTTMTRRDPRTAANRFSVLSNNRPALYAPPKETRLVPQPSQGSLPPPPAKMIPKSILKPLPADPRFYGTLSRSVTSESVDETLQFLAKQEILWKGFINMLTIAKFVSKAYLVSGPAESLKADLPDTIQIGGRILPETVWDYVDKVKTSLTKELCVMRFHPATEEEEVAYISLFSYFSSRRRFGVVASGNRSIKDLYLVPLGANESVPSMLQPLEGPGLETKRPNLLLGVGIIQKTKRIGNFPQELEEKKPKVHLAKDPIWIPKPPVLYGTDKLDVFQPYDGLETAPSSALPGSPSCPASPLDSSSSSLTKPSRPNSAAALALTAPATQSTSNSVSDKTPVTTSNDNTPLQAILNSLFGSNPAESTTPSEGNSVNTSCAKKPPALSQVAGTMVDPIVQQYGQKSKIKEIEEENDFDRPYDPEEEYDPEVGYGMTTLKSIEKSQVERPATSSSVDDDVEYDPEDETIFADVSGVATKLPAQTQISDSSSCDTPVSTQAATPTPASTTSSDVITPTLPSGTVVVSAATLNEQQRMLEELNKQIEEQKRQLKEQEEALRQQREAVGMFMAQFSVSDSVVSPPNKSSPLSQMASLKAQTDTKPSEISDKSGISSEISSNAEQTTMEPQETTVLQDNADQDETNTDVKDDERYSSAGEIEDSDVAYDPEDESFFKEVEEDPFEGNSGKTYDRSLSRRSRSTSHKGNQNSSHSRKRRLSPKRRSHRGRDHHRSPSRKLQRRSASHSQKRREKDRHRRSDRDRSRHRGRDHSERQGRHRKEHNTHHRSRHRRSPSSLAHQDNMSFSPDYLSLSTELDISSPLVPVKNEPEEQQIKCNPDESLDENCTTFSHDPFHKVKVEQTFSNHDDPAPATPMLVNKPIKQQNQIDSKVENTIPLREIDPPIRDSPESPDPEPQHVRPRSTETRDAANTENKQEAGAIFPGPISKVPEIALSSSNSILDAPIQKNKGSMMIESRNMELLVKGSERSPASNCEGPEAKGLLGHKKGMKTPEPEKNKNFQQNKNVVEPNMPRCDTEGISDFAVPREDQIFPTNGRRIEQTVQENRPFPNITNPDWRGHDPPAPGMRSQNTGFGPRVIDPHCSVEGSDMQEHWRGPTRRGPCVRREGPFVQGERKYQPKWRGPNIDKPRHNRNSPTDQDFMTPGPDIEGPMHDRRNPGNPHSIRTDPERGGSNNDNQECDIRGPRGAKFERRTPGPHFRDSWPEPEAWFEQRNLPMKVAEVGPGNPHPLDQDPIGPEYSEREPESRGYPMDHPGAEIGTLQGPDFRGPEQYINHPQSAKRCTTSEHKGHMYTGQISATDEEEHPRKNPRVSETRDRMDVLGHPEFKGQGLDRRSLREAPESDRRGPDKRMPFMSNRPDRVGPGGPDFPEPEADWRYAPMEVSGPMRTSLGGPMGAMEPGRIGPAGPESWRPESGITGPNSDGPGPERRIPRGQNLSGPHPDYPGAWPRVPGHDFMGMQPEKPGPRHHTRKRVREPFRGFDPESEYPCMEGPDSATFRGPGPERRPPMMARPHNSRGFPDNPRFGISVPERRSPAMDGCESERRGSHFRGARPEGPAMEGPAHIRRGFRGLDPNREPCDNIGTDIRGPEPNRQEQGVPRLRELGEEFTPGIRPNDPVPESHRPRRENWHETEFMGPESIEGNPDLVAPGPRGPSHTFRGPRRTNRGPRSESERWKEPNFRDSSLERRGMDLNDQWPEERGLSVEAVENERNYSGNDWKLYRDRSPRGTQEDEQFQRRQGPLEWRGPENRGPKMLQDRPNMHERDPRGEMNGPDFRSPGLVGDYPSMVHPGSKREDSRNEFKDQDGDEPSRWRTGISFRGPRDADSRRKGHNMRTPIMRGPGPDMRANPNVENDFRGNIGENMEGHQAFSRGPGFETSALNRGAEMEDLERRGPRDLESEFPGSESGNFTFDGPEANRRFSDSGRMRPERQGDNMENPGTINEGSVDFGRVNRGPNMRRLEPQQANTRNLPPGPSGPMCPDYDRQQSPQGVQPQGRKAALLPTPTGPICFPHHAVKGPGGFGPEGKHTGRSMPRWRGRGRPVSRDR